MRTETFKVLTFNELSEEAKDKARDWLKSLLDSSDYECVIEDAKEVASLIGINITSIYWSGAGLGAGACFEGRYSYKKGSVKAVKAFAPQDETLHRIAKKLQDLQKKHFYQLCAKVTHSGRYSHEFSTSINVWRDIPSWGGGQEIIVQDDVEDALKVTLRSFMRWIYSQLDKQNDYLHSDEAVDEAILANEYEFYEDGSKF